MKTNFLRFLMLFTALLLPLEAVAGGRIQADDIIAGLEGQAVLSGFASSTNVEVHLQTPAGDDIAIPARTDTTGNAVVAIPAGLTEEAGTYGLVVASRGVPLTGQIAMEVLPDRISPTASTMGADTTTIDADGVSQARITVTLRDAFGNALAGRPVELVSSRIDDVITPGDRQTDAFGRMTFAVRTRKAGDMILRAMDLLSGTTLASSVRISADSDSGIGGVPRNPFAGQVTDDGSAPAPSGDFGPATGFEVTLMPVTAKVKDVLSVTVRVTDEFNRTVENYVNTAVIAAPNDPDATLPGFGQIKFTDKNLGKKQLPLSVSFTKPGKQLLIVEDHTDPSKVIRGQVEITVTADTGTNETRRIEILSHKNDQTIKGTNILLEGIGPKLANLIITGGKADTAGETDEDGKFSIPVELDPSYNEYTIRIQDDNVDPSLRFDSGNLHLVRDGTGPELQFAFDPEEPYEGQDLQLTVQAESGLPDVHVTLEDRDIALSEDASEKGTYRVTLQAPAPGDYQPAVVAVDEAGNKTEVRGILHVSPRAIPPVQNLRAEPKTNGVDLLWDPVTEEGITSYLVYVGTGADNFSTTLDTQKPQEGASVLGLKPGVDYYFAVTAKKGELESSEKTVVKASPLGLALTVTPQDSALVLKWIYPEESLGSFLLEYGVEPGRYIERRQLNGDLRLYFLRDLLNGVTYYMRLTPVLTTGEAALDLSVTAEGTPVAGAPGFHPSAEDPVPFRPNTGLPNDNGLHAGAPSVPGSGVPPVALWGSIGASLVVFGFWWKRRRMKLQTAAFLQDMHQRYHG